MILRLSIVVIPILLLLWWQINKNITSEGIFRPKRMLFAGTSLLLIILTLFLSFNSDWIYHHSIFIGLFLSFLFFWIPFCLIEIFFCFILKKIKTNKHKRIAFLTKYILFLSLILIILSGLFYFPNNVKIKYLTYTSNSLPRSFNNYKIVQISDFHINSFKNNPQIVKGIVNRINSLRPDLIVFTGDLITNSSSDTNIFLPELKRITSRDGIFAIMGNHDYGYYNNWKSEKHRLLDNTKLENYIKEIGWTLLLDTCHTLYKNSDSIQIIGLEYDNKSFFKQKRLISTLKNLPPTDFQILLLHDPKSWDNVIQNSKNIQLTLCGHTHGFQTSILGFSPASLFFKYAHGLYYTSDNKALYVNTGIGEALSPMRIGIYPEITLITLKTKE